jgi:putative endonuclease
VSKSLGNKGELLARKYLEAECNMSVTASNWRAGRLGEIDIIASCKDTLHFVEVKTRRAMTCGGGLEAVTISKQQQIMRLAECYLAEYRPAFEQISLDVVVVSFNAFNTPIIEYYPNAFSH